MVSLGASSTYVRLKRRPLYVNNDITYSGFHLGHNDLTYSGFRLGRTYVELAPYLTIGVLVAQWLKRLTDHQKVAGSIPVCGSEIVFLRIELDKRSPIISRYVQVPTFLKCI